MRISSKLHSIAISLLLLSTPSAAFSDRAFAYGRFFAVVSSIEDRCDHLYARTEGFQWDDLSRSEYRRVMEIIQIERTTSKASTDGMTCLQAARFAAQLAGVSPRLLWEVRR